MFIYKHLDMTHWKAMLIFFLFCFVSKQTLGNSAFVILILVCFEFWMAATGF